MSTRDSHSEPTSTPLWVNVAAVVALVLFLTFGFLTLKHFSADDAGEPSGASGELGNFSGSDEMPEMKYIRPGEQPGRVIFTDADVDDAADFQLLAERDPKAAALLISQMPEGEQRDERLYTLMQIWVRKDPGQAAEWVTSLPVGAMKNDATAELGLAWGHLDPAAAAAWVDENIFTENAPAGAASVTSAWVRNDLEAATEWVASLDVDAPARAKAMRALAYHLAEIDPQRGLAWMARLRPEDRELVAVNFATAWAIKEPRAAADWLRFQASGIDQDKRDQALLAVVHTWTVDEKQAASASDWIDGLPDGDLKEGAKAAFAETHAETSPEESLPWAESISDARRRLEVTMVVLEEWITQDRDGFRAEISEKWPGYDEALRAEIFDLLLDYDPEFKRQLITLYEESTGIE